MDRLETLLPALTELNLKPEQALSEGVAPLLCYASPETAPPELRRAYYQTAARNVVLLDALEEATSRLGAKGIRPVVLKGADLATSLYPSPALRPMSDVDLWVEPDEVAAAEETLRALGYRPGCPEMTPGLARAVKHARLYVKGPGDSLAVDLHWSLVGHEEDRRAADPSWFRKHVRAHGLRLDPTAHLLYLAAHMKLQHYDEPASLLWLCDFFLLSYRGVDWDELLAASRTFGWTDSLSATAAEVEDRLEVALPEPLDALALPHRLPVPRRKGGAERAWNELSTLDGRGRAALVRGYLLPSPSYIRWRYRPRPGWSWPLYYALRWARLDAAVFSLAVRLGRHRSRARPLLEESP